MKHIFLIGTGLIGGSMLLDMRSHFSEATFYGIDHNDAHAQQAVKNGIIDQVAQLEDLQKADLVIVSIPVDATLKVLPQILDIIEENTLVIDVGSTKGAICNTVEEHQNRRQFLAAHPIAGTEFSGPDAAMYDLFREKTMIVCEVEKTAFKLQERAKALFDLLLASLDGYIENLSRFRESVNNNDYKAIYKEMAATNRIKEILEGINDGK